LAELNGDKFDDEFQIMQQLMQENKIALRDSDLLKPITTLNLKTAVTVKAGTPMRQCIDLALARRIGCLVVVCDGKLCGIITERDLLLKVAGQQVDLDKQPVDDFMTSDPVPITQNGTIKDALNLMYTGRYRHVTVVNEDNEPVNVVSMKDIVSYIVDFFPQDVLNLPPHPIRIGVKHREGG